MSGNKKFLDTNIIVYAYDSSAERKHEIAREIMIGLWESGLGILSTQVLQEFYVTVTQKIPKPMDRNSARQIIRDLLHWNVVVNDGGTLLAAIEFQKANSYSFWDAMIVQSALEGGADYLLSEDLESGRVINSMVITNPFEK